MFKAGKKNPEKELRDRLTRPDRPADRLLKANLAPVMGRRDAACDCAWELVKAGLSGKNAAEKNLRRLARLLVSARADTERIFAILSSPDTIAREQRLLIFLTLTAGAVENICNLLFLEENADHNAGQAALSARAAEYNSTWLCEYFTIAEPRLRRYRDYALKNFSSDYATRYQRAYDSFSKIFEAQK